MFFLSILLILGGSYIYWKYSNTVNKEKFFSSPFFLSITGSLLILFVSFLIVNNVADDRIEATLHFNNTDSTNINIDTSYHTLRGHTNLEYHDRLLTNVSLGNIDELVTIEKHYNAFTQENDKSINCVGHFGLGIILMKSEKYNQALEEFSSISDKSLPLVNFYLGQAYTNLNQQQSAEDSYWAELRVKDGYFEISFVKLLSTYKNDRNFSMIKKLIDEFPDQNIIPPNLIRQTYLHEGDFIQYPQFVFLSISSKARIWGIFAAAVISIVWILYLFQLSIFKKVNITPPILLFIGGCFSVLPVFLFNDLNDLFFQNDLTGEFFPDLFYSVFFIGAPEEFAKILPLIIFLLFKKIKEPIDYIIFASASALGFAFVENILYFQQTGTSIIHGRAYLSVIGHMVNSSIVAYAFALHNFNKKQKKKYILFLFLITFLAGSIVHGIFDFFLFRDNIIMFFIFFVFIVQIWIIIINNCLNGSPRFTYSKANYSQGISIYITLSLTAIFALEYLISGFDLGAEQANYEFYSNLSFAGFSIIFFTSNLSSFNLIKGYWRDVYFSSREKRGYGTLPPRTLLTSWYFVNSIKAHNYVGKDVLLNNDPYNRVLAEVLDQAFEGKLVNRIILFEGKDPDPHWFLLELKQPIPFENPISYALVKLRNLEDSLEEQEYVQVYFKTVNNTALLNNPMPQKNDFPSFGWVRLHSQS